jgi:hypothetical protein
LKILEFYCGTRSFSKVAEKEGHKVFTVDFNPKFKPDLCCDMLYFNKKLLPVLWRNPDMIWFSPPCETFSLSGNSMFMGFPTTPKAYIGLALAYKCVEVIQWLTPKFWVIENPRAGLRSAWFMKPLPRTTVSYCQYGDKRMKPTDIWNNFGFNGKCCNNGDSCHESAPRGSRTGTQGEKSTEQRGVIPEKLCEEILNLILRKEVNNGT